MGIDFQGRVAIVTGAGGGLGRQHALALAKRGAKVLVNDLGGAVDGSGGTVTAAQAVVDEIRAAGGEALANGASVTDFAAVEAMVQQAIDAWGRVDILVNNAGILRDKSFAKMDMADFNLVVQVHLMGAAHCCKAVWPHMVAQQYGRIVKTTSSTGLYGNFGQANYGAAKLAQVGLMQTLSIEGAKNNIHVNALAPTAATRMTEGLMPQEVLDALKPEAVLLSPGPCDPDQAGICLPILKTAPLDMPIFGVCLGHQAIGQAFGGDVIRAKTLMHGKTSPIEHEGRSLFKGLPSPFTATRYHSLAVRRETLPDELEVTAWTADGEIMGLAHRTRPIHGVQFHPESIATEHGHDMIANFLDLAGVKRLATI